MDESESPVRIFNHSAVQNKGPGPPLKQVNALTQSSSALIVHEEQFSLLHSTWTRKAGGQEPPQPGG